MLKDYKYLEHTVSLCPVCHKRLDAKIVEKNNSVFIQKNCPDHGDFSCILEEDPIYYQKRKIFDKPGNSFNCQTSTQKGCPYDCGLCPQHEQHTCIGLIEVTTACNLVCPVCYASSKQNGSFVTKQEFEKMVDFFIESEGGKADILQISGGEPTIHPDIIDLIAIARSRNLDYVMLNTNGIRIAEDEDFVKELSLFKGRFEVYLQFDGFSDSVYQHFRGRKLSEVKMKAIENLNKWNIPTTLVSTLTNNVNDQEIGKIVSMGMASSCIRGINFQPAAYFGRIPNSEVDNRLTITSVVRLIENQTSGIIKRADFIPLPCNADRVAITYFYKDKAGSFVPLTREMDVSKYLPYIKNTFKFDPDDFLKELSANIFTKECCNVMGFFKDLSKVIPLNYLFKTEQEKIDYVSANTFRISITSFIDAYNFDIKSAQKECVHVITPELKKIPFSMYNLIHRK